jgi:RNA polymerase sigma-70 factor (ECF subfamily)
MAPTAPDTDELIERARAGDSAAAEAVLVSHRDRLRRMVAVRLDRRIAARVDPSDVVQEALADAARGLPGYLRKPPLPFYPWLRQFAWERLVKLHRHHIHVQRRSVAREERRPGGLNDESTRILAKMLVAGGPSPSDRMIRDESRERVRAAMARLTAGDRNILVMRNLEALSMSEIAAVVGVSEGAVKVRHLRALRRLQALLETSR